MNRTNKTYLENNILEILNKPQNISTYNTSNNNEFNTSIINTTDDNNGIEKSNRRASSSNILHKYEQISFKDMMQRVRSNPVESTSRKPSIATSSILESNSNTNETMNFMIEVPKTGLFDREEYIEPLYLPIQSNELDQEPIITRTSNNTSRMNSNLNNPSSAMNNKSNSNSSTIRNMIYCSKEDEFEKSKEIQNNNASQWEIHFNSNFECGNLYKVYTVIHRNSSIGAMQEYDLYLQSDPTLFNPHINNNITNSSTTTTTITNSNNISTNEYCQWYLFRMQNMKKRSYKFNICNFTHKISSYTEGMVPFMISQMNYENLKIGWQQATKSIDYQKVIDISTQNEVYHLSFTIDFPNAKDTVYLAFAPPYSLTQLQNILYPFSQDKIIQKYLRIQPLCRSLSGNRIDLVIITEGNTIHIDNSNSNNTNLQQQQKQTLLSSPLKTSESDNTVEFGGKTLDFLQKMQGMLQAEFKDNEIKRNTKKGIFIQARTHGVDTISSYICEGIIKFLISDHTIAILLRKQFIFYIIPMVNPDSVVNGYSRFDIMGQDLSYHWHEPHVELVPSIYYIKKLLKSISLQGVTMISFFDICGQTSKNGIYFYSIPCEVYELDEKLKKDIKSNENITNDNTYNNRNHHNNHTNNNTNNNSNNDTNNKIPTLHNNTLIDDSTKHVLDDIYCPEKFFTIAANRSNLINIQSCSMITTTTTTTNNNNHHHHMEENINLARVIAAKEFHIPLSTSVLVSFYRSKSSSLQLLPKDYIAFGYTFCKIIADINHIESSNLNETESSPIKRLSGSATDSFILEALKSVQAKLSDVNESESSFVSRTFSNDSEVGKPSIHTILSHDDENSIDHLNASYHNDDEGLSLYVHQNQDDDFPLLKMNNLKSQNDNNNAIAAKNQRNKWNQNSLSESELRFIRNYKKSIEDRLQIYFENDIFLKNLRYSNDLNIYIQVLKQQSIMKTSIRSDSILSKTASFKERVRKQFPTIPSFRSRKLNESNTTINPGSEELNYSSNNKLRERTSYRRKVIIPRAMSMFKASSVDLPSIDEDSVKTIEPVKIDLFEQQEVIDNTNNNIHSNSSNNDNNPIIQKKTMIKEENHSIHRRKPIITLKLTRDIEATAITKGLPGKLLGEDKGVVQFTLSPTPLSPTIPNKHITSYSSPVDKNNNLDEYKQADHSTKNSERNQQTSNSVLNNHIEVSTSSPPTIALANSTTSNNNNNQMQFSPLSSNHQNQQSPKVKVSLKLSPKDDSTSPINSLNTSIKSPIVTNDDDDDNNENDDDEEDDEDDDNDNNNGLDFDSMNMSESLMLALGMDISTKPKIKVDWVPPNESGLQNSTSLILNNNNLESDSMIYFDDTKEKFFNHALSNSLDSNSNPSLYYGDYNNEGDLNEQIISFTRSTVPPTANNEIPTSAQNDELFQFASSIQFDNDKDYEDFMILMKDIHNKSYNINKLKKSNLFTKDMIFNNNDITPEQLPSIKALQTKLLNDMGMDYQYLFGNDGIMSDYNRNKNSKKKKKNKIHTIKLSDQENIYNQGFPMRKFTYENISHLKVKPNKITQTTTPYSTNNNSMEQLEIDVKEGLKGMSSIQPTSEDKIYQRYRLNQYYQHVEQCIKNQKLVESQQAEITTTKIYSLIHQANGNLNIINNNHNKYKMELFLDHAKEKLGMILKKKWKDYHSKQNKSKIITNNNMNPIDHGRKVKDNHILNNTMNLTLNNKYNNIYNNDNILQSKKPMKKDWDWLTNNNPDTKQLINNSPSNYTISNLELNLNNNINNNHNNNNYNNSNNNRNDDQDTSLLSNVTESMDYYHFYTTSYAIRNGYSLIQPPNTPPPSSSTVLISSGSTTISKKSHSNSSHRQLMSPTKMNLTLNQSKELMNKNIISNSLNENTLNLQLLNRNDSLYKDTIVLVPTELLSTSKDNKKEKNIPLKTLEFVIPIVKQVPSNSKHSKHLNHSKNNNNNDISITTYFNTNNNGIYEQSSELSNTTYLSKSLEEMNENKQNFVDISNNYKRIPINSILPIVSTNSDVSHNYNIMINNNNNNNNDNNNDSESKSPLVKISSLQKDNIIGIQRNKKPSKLRYNDNNNEEDDDLYMESDGIVRSILNTIGQSSTTKFIDSQLSSTSYLLSEENIYDNNVIPSHTTRETKSLIDKSYDNIQHLHKQQHLQQEKLEDKQKESLNNQMVNKDNVMITSKQHNPKEKLLNPNPPKHPIPSASNQKKNLRVKQNV